MNQRLEQALGRTAESDERSAALGREAEELRARLSAALAEVNAEDGGGGDIGVTAPAQPAQTDAAAGDASPLLTAATEHDLVSSSSGRPQGSPAREELEGEREKTESLELEECLAREQARSHDLQTDVEALVARVASAEKAGEEAMRAAATEASRGAETREGLENAEAELFGLRRRLAEWEEESARAAELMGTLESTRDALDEAR